MWRVQWAHWPSFLRMGWNHSGTFLMPQVQHGRPSLCSHRLGGGLGWGVNLAGRHRYLWDSGESGGVERVKLRGWSS